MLNKTQIKDLEKEYNLETKLKELCLEIFFENFVAEAIDLKMLLILFNESDMKECMKDIGIKRFGDRHKLIEKIRIMKRNEINENKITINSDQLVEQDFGTEILLQESYDVVNDDNINDEMVPEKECDLCITSKHTKLCGKTVCNLFCSIQDP